MNDHNRIESESGNMTNNQEHPVEGHGQAPKKASGLGIASFVISLIAIVTIIIGIVLLTQGIMNSTFVTNPELLDSMNQDELLNELGPSVIIGALLPFGSIAIAFVGLILGIIGAASKKHSKALAIVGIVLNSLIVLGFIGLIVIALASLGGGAGVGGISSV
ncbi:hypothetical protein ACFO9Q_06050 [Paenibacillus sp. GCM10023252]|uniref:hypothetical protein n=1 Tax=Paenibacillus sp. GCM10023252 TaxID=3252649 RepID=UPI003620E351